MSEATTADAFDNLWEAYLEVLGTVDELTAKLAELEVYYTNLHADHVQTCARLRIAEMKQEQAETKLRAIRAVAR